MHNVQKRFNVTLKMLVLFLELRKMREDKLVRPPKVDPVQSSIKVQLSKRPH